MGSNSGVFHLSYAPLMNRHNESLTCSKYYDSAKSKVCRATIRSAKSIIWWWSVIVIRWSTTWWLMEISDFKPGGNRCQAFFLKIAKRREHGQCDVGLWYQQHLLLIPLMVGRLSGPPLSGHLHSWPFELPNQTVMHWIIMLSNVHL